MPKSSGLQVFEQRAPRILVHQEYHAFFPDQRGGGCDDLGRSVGEHRPQGRPWTVRYAVGAEAINERNRVAALNKRMPTSTRRCENDMLSQPKDSPQPHVLPRIGVVDFESATHEPVFIVDFDAIQEVA